VKRKRRDGFLLGVCGIYTCRKLHACERTLYFEDKWLKDVKTFVKLKMGTTETTYQVII